MLPSNRLEDYTFSVPKMDITVRDVENFGQELLEYFKHFHDGFFRSETREHAALYLAGLLSPLERKSIEPIALNLKDVPVRTLQYSIGGAKWKTDLFGLRLRQLVKEDMADEQGVLVTDESSFQKKGEESVGVARQYCGSLGKVENCQVGVFLAYVSPSGYAFVDKRLYLPEDWFDAEHEEKRKKCDLPKDLKFKTKPQLAAEMVLGAYREKLLPFRWVLGDSIYGDNEDFIRAVEKCTGVSWFVSTARDTRCFIEGKLQVGKPRKVEDIAKDISSTFWYRRKVSECTKGPIVYEFARRRVVVTNDGKPVRTVWLLIRRTLNKSRIWYYLSNAPASTRMTTMVWLSGLRWAIEQGFEECKGETGMDHYEMRGWSGWNNHMLMAMAAHFFLWHLIVRLGKKNVLGYGLADP